MQRQRIRLQSRAHLFEETPGVSLVLEAGDQIIGIAHDDHPAGCLVPLPVRRPQVGDVVQVNVRQQRRYDALNAKGNFRFEREIRQWRGGPVVDLRRKR
jgi:hypothetical protein